jgi:hypothetical protein
VLLRLPLCLAVVPGIAFAADLKKEDLHSIQEAVRKKDPSLDSILAEEKTSLDANRSLILVRAWPGAVWDPEKTWIGAFVVAGPQNRVQLILDWFSESEEGGLPEIGTSDANSVSLHFYTSYGFYRGSIKYFYDLSTGKPPLKFRYGMPALVSSAIRNGRIVYEASSLEHRYEVTIDLPAYKITDAPAPPQELPEPVSLRLADGRTVLVTNIPDAQPHQLAGMTIIDQPGTRKFYPAPFPTVDLILKLRPNEGTIDISNYIGPVAPDGSNVWFANGFYNDEGASRVGSVGRFDLRTHQFEMRYLPEIVDWSGSAIRLDGDDLWIGLMHLPEGAAFSGGLLRYNLKTGSVAKFEVPDIINTIDRVGDTEYCGTSNGLYTVRGKEIRPLTFEPDSSGKLTMVAKNVGR